MLKLNEGEVLISFDVVSLYTNVPVLVAIQEAVDRFYCGEFEVQPVTKDNFTELMKLASTNVVMSTHDGYYIQKDGLAMRSPPALAKIWLANRDKHIRDDAKLFVRYMDDILRSIQQSHIQEKHEQMAQNQGFSNFFLPNYVLLFLNFVFNVISQYS